MAKRIKYDNGQCWIIPFPMAVLWMAQYQMKDINELVEYFGEVFDVDLRIAIKY